MNFVGTCDVCNAQKERAGLRPPFRASDRLLSLDGFSSSAGSGFGRIGSRASGVGSGFSSAFSGFGDGVSAIGHSFLSGFSGFGSGRSSFSSGFRSVLLRASSKRQRRDQSSKNQFRVHVIIHPWRVETMLATSQRRIVPPL
jgi:hypothetical protein